MAGAGVRRLGWLGGQSSSRGADGLTVEKGISGMQAPHLRVYCGPQDEPTATESQVRRETVTVPLMDVLPLLADAVRSARTWLRDFSDDEVTISTDLYEVLLAYKHYCRPSA